MYGVRINYGNNLSHDELRDMFEVSCEGVVRANQLWLLRNKGPQSLVEAGVKYEEPRHDDAQHPDLDMTPAVLKRKRATCWPTACHMAAVLRNSDIDCLVKVIDVFDPVQKRPRMYQYHAVVLAGTQVYDPTLDLPGYNAAFGHDEWFKNHGHCCPNCALQLTCAAELEGGSCDCDH